MAHTPGPCTVRRIGSHEYGIWPQGYTLHGSNPETVEADATLYAAAPELLKACRVAADTLETVANLFGSQTQGSAADTLAARRVVEAAIAKATGQTTDAS